ncbi:MAG: hypothetical protein B7Z66_14495 [Chromatiales bacterium 21-64-14]|nr:MAG: hypothetical protein B7Z66_14495 [Chromatiales bacterium 21-64-14]
MGWFGLGSRNRMESAGPPPGNGAHSHGHPAPAGTPNVGSVPGAPQAQDQDQQDATGAGVMDWSTRAERLPRSKVMMGYRLIEAQVRDEVAAWLVSVERLARDASEDAPIASHFFDGHQALIRRRLERLESIATRLDRMGTERAAAAMDIERLRFDRDRERKGSSRYCEWSRQIEARLQALAAGERRRVDLVMEGWMESREVILSVRLLGESIDKMIRDRRRTRLPAQRPEVGLDRLTTEEPRSDARRPADMLTPAAVSQQRGPVQRPELPRQVQYREAIGDGRAR